MAPRLPLLVFVLACVAAIAFLPAVAEAKKKNKPPVPALIYYINQTTPACTKKTTYPAWMCTPSPFKFFTQSKAMACVDANNTVDDAADKQLDTYCPVSVSADGATFEDVRIPCFIYYQQQNPLLASPFKSFEVISTQWSAVQNCSNHTNWGWSGQMTFKGSNTPCGVPATPQVNLTYTGQVLYSMTGLKSACPSNVVTGPCVAQFSSCADARPVCARGRNSSNDEDEVVAFDFTLSVSGF